MRVKVNRNAVVELLDVLLARWRTTPRQYPFNRKDAILPQTTLPANLRENKRVLACFYFYACVYMRGGIESLQAFAALVRIWKKYPHLFEPAYAAMLPPDYVQSILKEYIGWDSRAASRYWVENSRRLMQHWSGNPLLLVSGARSYNEALRRVKNKRTKRELKEVGLKNGGFLGFQPKMVSMLVYFYDWEGWLKPRFLYPAPADFHNFRLALATEAMIVEGLEDNIIRTSEKISRPWREAVMSYLKARKADPIEVADVLWLFSLLMCGYSPATTTKEINGGGLLFVHAGVAEEWRVGEWAIRKRRGFEKTCLVCPFLARCKYGIPSKPYYRKGLLVLRERPKIEEHVDPKLVPDPIGGKKVIVLPTNMSWI